jgi:NAD(P)-dependent dehydrogenase (short-subunit alcohol dehydrogenase family)
MARPVTLILGLGREIGESVARRFTEAGHQVLVADPSDDRLEAARDALGDEAFFHHGELHSKLGLRNALTAALEAFGRIDHVIVLPLAEEADRLLDFAQDRFEKALARSARGAALALRVAAEQMLEQEDRPENGAEHRSQKGSITFVLRYSAAAAMPGQFTDTVSQAAILGVMRAGALELAEHAIRVNAIIASRPGEERGAPASLARVPLGRAILADEIAGAAWFLASSDAAFVTGQTLVMDGGRAILSGVLT